MLKVFDNNYTLLRSYIISQKKVQYLKGDFPESFEAMMKGEYPQYLIRQAGIYGPQVKKLIEMVLHPHAFIKARCAKGILEVIKEYKDVPLLQDICAKAIKRNIHYPKTLKIMLEDEKKQLHLDFIPRSSSGETMIRDIKEYLN